MSVGRFAAWALGVVVCASSLAACSADEDSPAVSQEPVPTSASAVSEFAIGDFFDTITVTVAEPGPRPLLTWAPVAGASLYRVSVLDESGLGYWTWAGTATEIHVGGTAEPDAIGPYVYEEMTWMVAAEDDSGSILAVSEPSPLTP